MKTSRVAVLGLTLAGVSLCLFEPTPAPAQNDQVEPMVTKAVNFLKKSGAGGGWPYITNSTDDNIGMTALVGLALNESKIPGTEGLVKSAVSYIKSNLPKLNQPQPLGVGRTTYGLSFAVVFLDRVTKDSAAIRELTVRIAAAQDKDTGTWGYASQPLEGKKTAEWHKWLQDMKGKKIPDPKAHGGMAGDHSNSQLAVLALWIGRKHGVQVDYPLLYAEKHFRNTQSNDGGWGYGINDSASTMSMTCAGLIALCVGFGAKSERVTETTVRNGGGKLEDKGVPPTVADTPPTKEQFLGDNAVHRARQFLAGQVGNDRLQADHKLYFLWSLERVCVAYGWEQIEGKDWYKWGCNVLQGWQAQDGSWPAELDQASGAIANTAFGILFLKKANLIDDVTGKLKATVVTSKDPNKGTGTPKTKADEQAAKDADRKFQEEEAARIEREAKKQKEAEVKKLKDTAIFGIGPLQDAALKKLRDEPNRPDFAIALAEVCGQTNGGLQDQAREYLAERMKRLKPDILETYLTHQDKELRMGATWACALRDAKSLIGKILPLLNDKEPLVADKAYEALKLLSGQDFGKEMGKWSAWWAKNGDKFTGK